MYKLKSLYTSLECKKRIYQTINKYSKDSIHINYIKGYANAKYSKIL